jgi:CRISPR-associated protein Cas2
MRYVVAYDIEDDRARARIADVLERFGLRVQKSVFECRLEGKDLDRLIRRLERELTAVGGAGNIRIYRLCADCYGASKGLGSVARAWRGSRGSWCRVGGTKSGAVRRGRRRLGSGDRSAAGASSGDDSPGRAAGGDDADKSWWLRRLRPKAPSEPPQSSPEALQVLET